jgi:hypothetical protein
MGAGNVTFFHPYQTSGVKIFLYEFKSLSYYSHSGVKEMCSIAVVYF